MSTIIAKRRKSQAPPPHVIWDELIAPGAWLELTADEVRPRVLDSHRPDHLTWSSLWPDRPDDRIRFDLERDMSGTMLTWTLTGDECAPSLARQLRYRINQLINGAMRAHFDL